MATQWNKKEQNGTNNAVVSKWSCSKWHQVQLVNISAERLSTCSELNWKITIGSDQMRKFLLCSLYHIFILIELGTLIMDTFMRKYLVQRLRIHFYFYTSYIWVCWYSVSVAVWYWPKSLDQPLENPERSPFIEIQIQTPPPKQCV